MRGGFYECIGVLVQQGLIDITLVDTLFRNHIIDYWVKVKPVIYGGREQRQEPSQYPFYDSFEYLYNRLKNINRQ